MMSCPVNLDPHWRGNSKTTIHSLEGGLCGGAWNWYYLRSLKGGLSLEVSMVVDGGWLVGEVVDRQRGVFYKRVRAAGST